MRRLRMILLVTLTVLAGLGPIAHPTSAQGDGEPGSLGAMLSLLPLLPIGGDAQAMITYADVALQTEAVGVTPDDPDWTRALTSMLVHSQGAKMNTDEWRDVFGFGLTDIEQAVEFSAPPTGVTVLRGQFDPEALITRWVETGYEAREVDQAVFYSIGDDFAVDLQSPVSRLALASANYIAVLDGETIAFAPSEALIVATLEASAGTGNSMADEITIAPLIAGAPDDLVSGVIVSGTSLIAVGDPAAMIGESSDLPDPDEIATQIAEDMAAASAMPALTSALLGSTAGGPIEGLDSSTLASDEIPTARAVAVAATVSNAAAETAAEVIDARLQESTGALDWSEFFTGWTIEVVEGEPAVRVEFDLVPGRNPGVLHQMLFQRELSFLSWLP